MPKHDAHCAVKGKGNGGDSNSPHSGSNHLGQTRECKEKAKKNTRKVRVSNVIPLQNVSELFFSVDFLIAVFFCLAKPATGQVFISFRLEHFMRNEESVLLP